MSHRAKAAIAKALMEKSVPDRWMAEITYLDGRPHQTITFEELEDLDEIVERGPDWNTIDKIIITLNRPCPSCWEQFEK
ncbi:hypothetical protein [Bradyrhizobium japonicum]|uniref:hypothetical protein n=1 Tax=Bradyrhizobium japonicum TaxID=375 RepID=UPI001BA6C07B|nr:hypothetical protein [Bradyrhizobium japonicum]MBR0916517.1 hypothetical protein [Bradyrhizobium japonicum]